MARRSSGCCAAWMARLAPACRWPSLPPRCARWPSALAGEAAWRGPDGRIAAELLAELEQSVDAVGIAVGSDDVVPLLAWLDGRNSGPSALWRSSAHFIWGLIEARLQKADLMILGGMNEGVWPSLPSPDPWLAPQIRRQLGLPGLEYRTGLAAHDFMSALGAPRVLLTRARRDSRSPTVASRLWLRLQAMTGGMTRDQRLERLAAGAGCKRDGGARQAPGAAAADRSPAQEDCGHRSRPAEGRSVRILCQGDPSPSSARSRSMPSIMPPGRAPPSTRCWRPGSRRMAATRPSSRPGREAMIADEAIHPMLRALWAPRLMEAVDWIAAESAADREPGECRSSPRNLAKRKSLE